MRKAYILLLCCISLSLSSQTNEGLFPPVEVFFNSDNQPFIEVTIDENMSVYKASKLFNTDIQKILKSNKIKDVKDIPKGTKIKLGFDLTTMFTGTHINGYKTTQFAPVIYTVQPKETLFRISKIYSGQKIEDILKRNNMKDQNLEIGQKLVLGWLPIDAKSKTFYAINKPEQVVANADNKQKPMEAKEMNNDSLDVDKIEVELAEENMKKVIRNEKGIAIWSRESRGSSKFVLHNSAKINSDIEIYNPLVRRKVKAKVVGRIPVGAYNEDVSVILSPATARSLGALDSRLKVMLTYAE